MTEPDFPKQFAYIWFYRCCLWWQHDFQFLLLKRNPTYQCYHHHVSSHEWCYLACIWFPQNIMPWLCTNSSFITISFSKNTAFLRNGFLLATLLLRLDYEDLILSAQPLLFQALSSVTLSFIFEAGLLDTCQVFFSCPDIEFPLILVVSGLLYLLSDSL